MAGATKVTQNMIAIARNMTEIYVFGKRIENALQHLALTVFVLSKYSHMTPSQSLSYE